MKVPGIIGGISPESTVEYYRSIISAYNELNQDGNNPQIIINSIDMNRMIDLIKTGKSDELIEYLSKEINKLAFSGADFGVLTSNTPHIVFNDLQKNSHIPLISIVEETRKKAEKTGLKKLGLLGTKFIMESNLYTAEFSKKDISVIVPCKPEREYIHKIIMDELVKGIFTDKTKKGLLEIIKSLKKNNSIQGLILACTELPLILSQEDEKDILILNTVKIHVKSIVDQM
ncbi:aspartate/glutamate racemase family protein [candidate division KSB1 bacterium]